MTSNRFSRPPVKQDHIIGDLRGRILDRTYAPGSRMPRRSDLQVHFQVSSVTIQRALDRLIDDGFVEARGRQGTFVSDHPPHQCNYGLLFSMQQADAQFVRFWTALGNEAQAMSREKPFTISRYYGIDGHEEHADHQRLMRDIRNQRLAGLIHTTTPPKGLAASPVVTQPGVPRVCVMNMSQDHPNLVPMVLSQDSFITQALDYLHGRGRRRVAIYTVPGQQGAYYSGFCASLASRGMSTQPQWLQLCPPWSPECARYVTHLMMHPGQRQRPDALVIADDNLVEHATVGLVAAGVQVPDDCDIVAHCNFPWPTPSLLPVRRLGYDARQLLTLAMQEIDRQRSGQAPSKRLDLPARFEGDAPIPSR